MKISVILCAYNASRYIREAMDSIIAQKYDDWEAICIDDGSKDDSGVILEEYSKRDARIKVFHQENKGLAASRNRGVVLSSGDYITFCDADDKLSPYWFSNAAELIIQKKPDLLRAHLVFAREIPKGFSLKRNPNVELQLRTRRDCLLWAWKVFFSNGFAVLNFISKDMKPFIRFTENLLLKEDTIMFVNLAPRLNCVVQSDDIGYFYRNTPLSMLRNKRVSQASVRYLMALLEIWQNQQSLALDLGVQDELKHALQKFSDNDVIDWAVISASEPHSSKLQVLSAWQALRKAGAFDGSYSHRSFLYLPFLWWKVSGREFPIKLTWLFFLWVRKLMPRKLIEVIRT